MGYAVYEEGGRWCGYGVPAICDMPGCDAHIDRGLAYKCEEHTAYNKDGIDEVVGEGCGLFFCGDHRYESHDAAVPSPDTEEWIRHMLVDFSWDQWRRANRDKLTALLDQLPT